MNRRDFFKLSAVAAVTMAAQSLKATTTIKKAVVVGGGFSGATCAKYLKLWGGKSIDVTLIEPNSTYTSPILSNLVLNNAKEISNLQFTYDNLKSYGINIINQKATSFDIAKKTLTLKNNTTLNYDKLVLAPGIDFDYVNNYDITKIPHAWIAGGQTTILKKQIDALKDGDTFVMSIPKAPYRCPPGPYERACVIADYLIDKGVNINVIVLDENPDIIVEKNSFSAKFNEYSIDYRANSAVANVDDANMQITYNQNGNSSTINAEVINVIPNQKAGEAVFLAGVNDSSGFAPVDTKSYESLLKKDVHIIGDAHKSSQPKAGHIGNGEGKICADAILRELNGYTIYDKPKTNSTCYSPVSNQAGNMANCDL